MSPFPYNRRKMKGSDGFEQDTLVLDLIDFGGSDPTPGAVGYVSSQGLMSGTGSGKFSPDVPTTRAMLATILYRIKGQPPVPA